VTASKREPGGKVDKVQLHLGKVPLAQLPRSSGPILGNWPTKSFVSSVASYESRE